MWQLKEVKRLPMQQATEVTYMRTTDLKEMAIVIYDEWTICDVTERVVPELLSLCEHHPAPEAE